MQRQAFLRERIFAEMARRREVGTKFKKSLWLYSRRVQKVRDIGVKAAGLKAKGESYSDLTFRPFRSSGSTAAGHRGVR
jgi:hypothetical protein